MKVYIGPFPKKGKRKIKIKMDGYDTWNLDSTLAYILVVALKQMKKDNNGIPSTMFGDDYKTDLRKGESRKAYKNRLKKSESVALKRWLEILDKMIWSFQQINRDYQTQYYSGRSDIRWVLLKETKDLPEDKQLYEMKKGPKDTFRVDRKGLQKHEERIQEGIDLFAKHFRSLWT